MGHAKITLKQEGIVRSGGYQVTQWISDAPPGSTDPPTLLPLFVMRNVGDVEYYERVASLTEMQSLEESHLLCFEAKGTGGDNLYVTVDPVQGDYLSIVDPRLNYWLQATAPYANREFPVFAKEYRDIGPLPKTLVGGYIQLFNGGVPYAFKNKDVGCWIELGGFTSPSYNGLCKILSITGNTAKVSKSFTTNESGLSYGFPIIRINPYAGAGVDSKYFPTVESGIQWELRRGSSLVCSGNTGTTFKLSVLSPSSDLRRTSRFTTLEATQAMAEARMEAVKAEVQGFQTAAAKGDTPFTVLRTWTFGP
jgi:hypothetical protein